MVRNLKKGLVSTFLLLFALNGCTAVLIGAGAAGGVALSNDEVSTFIDTDSQTIFDRSQDVLIEMGQITQINKNAGIIRVDIGDSKVICIIEVVTEKTVKLRVKARKNCLPNVDLAHIISTKIMKRCKK